MKQKQDSGFALLISLIVVGVVISIGMSVLDLTIKQVRLSTNAKQSELAFHAANAGMECARYWRRESAAEMEVGNSIAPLCFGGSPDSPPTIDDVVPAVSGDGEAFLYTYEFTWGGVDQRCTQINTVVASSSVTGAGMTITNMTTLIEGYPNGSSQFCEARSRCTTISVRGYNRPCSTATGYGSVQREVLLQF